MTRDGRMLRGDRHLGPTPDGQVPGVDKPLDTVVRITASEEATATVGGQLTLWMVTNLLARQFGVVSSLQVRVPRASLLPNIAPFGACPTLQETLEATAAHVGGELVSIRSAVGEPDYQVRVGAETPESGRVVTVVGSGWRLWLGHAAGAALLDPDEVNALGPFLGACCAAGEVFKRAVGVRPGNGRLAEALALSLWDSQAGEPAAGPDLEGLTLPDHYLIGAGAVGQAYAATLMASTPRAHLTVIDRKVDLTDETNGNRYCLMGHADVGLQKDAMTANYLRNAGFSVVNSTEGWPGYALESHPDQPAHVREMEGQFRYRLMLSCVDGNNARRGIQSYWPEHLFGASTLNLGVEVTSYDMRTRFECLKCNNPPEARLPGVEQQADELRAMTLADRRALCSDRGWDAEAVEAYLRTGECGSIGEQELARFSDAAGQRDWSVGFVSVAAGVLLASRVYKYALGIEPLGFERNTGATLRFNFLRPQLRYSAHLRSQDCECQGSGRKQFEGLWGAGAAP